MDILLVASEIAPWVERSSVAEAVASFSKTLKQVGHNVTVVVPYVDAFEQAGLLLARRLSKLKFRDTSELTVYDTQLTSGVQLVLIELPNLAGAGLGPAAAVQFSQAVAALLNDRSSLGTHTDIVHVHDLLGSLVALAIEQLDGPKPPTVLTIYDDFGAAVPASSSEASEFGPYASMPELALNGQLSQLAAAVRSAKCVTTPSHLQARSLTDPSEFGPLAEVVKSLPQPLIGIPGGVDYARANPATDAQLPTRYDAEDCTPKSQCKSRLQQQLGLELDVATPLLFIPGPILGNQSGAIFENILSALLDYPLSVAIARHDGDDEDATARVNRLASQWPKRIAVLSPSANQVNTAALSAADFVLLSDPRSVLESYHLFALRYGAVPVACLVGVHADHLVDCDAKLDTGNCFVFDVWTPDAILGALSRAVTSWSRPEFARLRRRGMRQDLGWERPARRMIQAYRQVLGIKV